jgi:hypothetical protein
MHGGLSTLVGLITARIIGTKTGGMHADASEYV